MKCSFCEQSLVCRHCGKPFQPRRGETHVGVFQPDMQVSCPECQHVLTCKHCGFVYGEDQEESDDEK